MMRAGAMELTNNVERVNALNVFPVPDGDTGTNMNLTITTGVAEMEKKAAEPTVGKLAEALSKGLLMGARGNSGVILSQLFRGFAKSVSKSEVIGPKDLADAFQAGVDTAYKAVIKPVEGTVLTVAREAAAAGVFQARVADDPLQVMDAVVKEARKSLARTPDLLPVLKQTGVVDAGGQGLVFVYEGMKKVLAGEEVSLEAKPASNLPSLKDLEHEAHAGANIDPATIVHGYCTEFMILLSTTRRKTRKFNEVHFREEISQYGDSLLVVSDDELVKVHIHAEHPGDALNYASTYGDLTRIKIDNMREQFENVTGVDAIHQVPVEKKEPEKPYGIVAVATGQGISDIFESVGVDVVITGGQSMNPSTEDLVKAVESISAEHVLILPNNKNIILTAEQVGQLVNVDVTVIPTKTIPQGLSALLAFDEEKEIQDNKEKMNRALTSVQSGEVTYAVRDTVVDGITIEKDDFLGIREGKIITAGKKMVETSYDLLSNMMTSETEVVTILFGSDVSEEETNELVSRLTQSYPDVEYEVYEGGQPLYYFLFAVE
ncbi:DAK2 domain-containing protein [Shimazuella sp. AN120528]|nr:DAK2 domain-containing protein [Shimazuella soli]MCH5584936.1 DAK2 domain-containing protein [Shimazuella soli]